MQWVLPGGPTAKPSSVTTMRSRAGRITLIVVGIVALLVGAVFAGQGANLIPGSSMTGDRTWLYIGLALAVIGVVLLVAGIRRRGSGR
jgi:uncharacterized membrane protein YidH (DUF202 family)